MIWSYSSSLGERHWELQRVKHLEPGSLGKTKPVAAPTHLNTWLRVSPSRCSLKGSAHCSVARLPNILNGFYKERESHGEHRSFFLPFIAPLSSQLLEEQEIGTDKKLATEIPVFCFPRERKYVIRWPRQGDKERTIFYLHSSKRTTGDPLIYIYSSIYIY